MKFSPVILIVALFSIYASPAAVQADELVVNEVVTASDLKPNVPQPYIVKKGDTLWDIADHFFKDPWKWLKIWERNLYITNPDLIYPGSEIWFDGGRPGGLRVVKLAPHIVVKPVERLEGAVDSSIVMTALMRQDFIHPDQLQGVGHILDARDERINFGLHELVYAELNQPANSGTLFDVFRTTKTVVDPASGDAVGVLVEHLGQIRVTSEEGGVHRAVVEKVFQEISRGDRLKPARDPDLKVVPQSAARPMSGSVLYIRHNGELAGQHQVLGISLGIRDGIKAGTVMSIYQNGRVINDAVSGEKVRLPREKVGQVIVLVPQEQASLALITDSTAPIKIGDTVLSTGQQ
ncbi:LysM domain-containing protein [Mariprofundus ferrinatatus]|uniref:LysM domain-containing protein n=1 Tax=Mariprofundus ferrinatatus TaxID=1921087 RepID=A0A2K8LDU4_9PROT|nr:LysM peptidoglycan-binding domain-containing protein [Mariprofundus ferrinatatus]ATX83084.1 LysM domain-containing protein [Mariprofundus ferrinatatus]